MPHYAWCFRTWCTLTAPGGTLICSGLLNGQLPEWKTELAEQDFQAIAEAEQEDWAAVMFQHLAKCPILQT